jgi:hypothetical protein
MRYRPEALLLLALSAVAGRAWAQATEEDRRNTLQTADAIVLPTGESPAFVFLGTSPSSITRPTTVKNLGASLLQGVGADGRVKQGVAFELTPAFYLTKVRLTEYQTQWDKYAISNLQLSLGTVRSSGDTASTDLAIGIRMPLFDAGDPLRNKAFTDEVGAKLKASCVPGTNPDGSPADFDPRANLLCMAKAIDSVATAWDKAHWNASGLMFAGATGLQLKESRFGERRWNGLQFWLSGGLGLGNWGSLVTQATYADNRRSGVDSLQYKALRLGSRLLVGGVRLNGFLEGEFESRWDRSDPIKKDDGQWSAGVEFRVNEQLWLSTGIGEPYEALEQADRTAVFANLRWGVSSKERMDPR